MRLSDEDLIQRKTSYIPKSFKLTALVLVLLIFATAFHLDFYPSVLIEGLGGSIDLFSQMLPPNFEKFDSILNSVAITIGMAFVGTAGAFLIAIPLSFLVSKNTRVGNISAQSLNVIATVTRSIPDIVFALIILRLIGLGPLAGALAIMIGSTGSLARLLANAIDQNDNLSRTSLLSLGAGRATASIVATLREVFPSFLSIVVYRLEINVKTSTILGVVGAGGVGSLLRTSLLQFDFQRAAAISVALVVTIYILEVLSTVARYLLVGQKALNQSKTTNKLFQNLNPRILKTALSVALIALAVLGCLLSVKYVLSSFEFKERNLEDFFLVLVQLSAPDFVSSGWGLFGDMLQTVEIAFLATFIGAVIGIPFAFFAAWNISPNKFIYFISRSLMTIIRGMPNVMFALLFVVAAGLGPVAGVFAMSLSSFGLCSKLVADSLEMALPEPRLALIAGGASRVQEFISATFPQVKFQIMGNLLFALDINVRQATLLGLVGAGGIGYALIESAHNFQFGTLSAIVILIVVTVLAIEYFSKYLQKAARRNQLL